MSISLGETRSMYFRNKQNGESNSIILEHGDVLIMTRSSQEVYSHCIPKEPCNHTRISITFRFIKPPNTLTSSPASIHVDNLSIDNSLAQELASLADIPDGYQVSPKSHDLQPLQPPRTTQNKSTFMGNKPPSHKPTFTKKNIPAPVKSDTNNTVYISSSMFRFLDPIQLSSERQMAHVFFYPGADASQMHDRLTQDPKYNELHNYSVQKVYILTGSNNVDNIYLGKKYLQEGTRGISNLIHYLKGHFKQAVINVINILPRRTI